MLHWEEFIQLFNEKFATTGELSLNDFLGITFKTGKDVREYSQNKMHAGRALGLDTKLLLEGLTDG